MGSRTWFTGGAAALAACAALLSTPAQAVNASIHVQFEPPAPRYAGVPVARYGQAWVPGHWEWRRHRQVWIPGHFVSAHAGYPVHHAGHGRRDLDRDGIPDRFDRDLDNDGRPNHRDFDRDGDGVPNHRDRAPDHRWRY